MHRGVKLPEFFDFLGVSIIEASPERAVLRMDVPSGLRSPYDYVHGGAVAALIDTACGTAVACKLTRSDRTATHALNVSYVSLANESALLCTATVLRAGRTAATVEGEVRTEDGRLVAKALGTFGIFRDAGEQGRAG